MTRNAHVKNINTLPLMFQNFCQIFTLLDILVHIFQMLLMDSDLELDFEGIVSSYSLPILYWVKKGVINR